MGKGKANRHIQSGPRQGTLSRPDSLKRSFISLIRILSKIQLHFTRQAQQLKTKIDSKVQQPAGSIENILAAAHDGKLQDIFKRDECSFVEPQVELPFVVSKDHGETLLTSFPVGQG